MPLCAYLIPHGVAQPDKTNTACARRYTVIQLATYNNCVVMWMQCIADTALGVVTSSGACSAEFVFECGAAVGERLEVDRRRVLDIVVCSLVPRPTLIIAVGLGTRLSSVYI